MCCIDPLRPPLDADLRRVLVIVCCVTASCHWTSKIWSFWPERRLSAAPDVRCSHNECLSCGTNQAFANAAIAYAQSLCVHSNTVAATQQSSPDRPFEHAITCRFHTMHSLQSNLAALTRNFSLPRRNLGLSHGNQHSRADEGVQPATQPLVQLAVQPITRS